MSKRSLPSVSHDLAPHGAVPPVWPGFLTGQADQPVRVLLIDDDAPMRREIAHELLADRRVRLVGQGSSVREGRQLISQSDFDVLLVDLNLGDGTGFALIEHLKAVLPLAEAVVISAMEDEQHALRAFELGATGYLVKNSWFGSFPQAVLQVVNGGASITPNLARRLLGRFEPAAGSAPAAANPHKARGVLSEREKAVLTLVAAGHTSTDIGARLGIGSQTVNTHIKNIYRKLNVHNRAHAVSFAATHGLF
ncbi:response regulator transcription factor [Polaromonas glacialis]|uniref:response regulator transcription factor n=1 Tax=Polaromonas glacialis TaxID=866564 RepID=UPI001E49BFC2|nr:response regulator transcription factor [Polaromonas glacialis]